MAIHWQVKFKSLRAQDGNEDYTVSIYDSDYSGNPIQLKGGAEPFVTQEDDDEDLFQPIRQQSGYIRIVDDGRDASGNQLASGWLRQLLPANDLSLPVVLTNGLGDTLWQGYLQAQNFSGTLYGNPQERDLPVQCVLSVLSAKDASTTEKDIHNFAWLLNYLLASIGLTPSSSPLGIDYLFFQGKDFALDWLKKRIDWQNFVSIDEDGTVKSDYDHYTMLEDICKFWGWTARTHGRDLWFTCADDEAGAPDFKKLTMSQLAAIANGTAEGTDFPNETYTSLTLTGDIFADNSNDDIMVRGASKAVVTADWNSAGDTWFSAFPQNITKNMLVAGWGNIVVIYIYILGHPQPVKYVQYTNRIASINTGMFSITCAESASLALMRVADDEVDLTAGPKPQYLSTLHTSLKYNGTAFIQIESVYGHVYDGSFKIKADIYNVGDKYTRDGVSDIKTIKIRFGIGKTRATAKWYNGNYGWSSSMTIFDAHIGYDDSLWRFGTLNSGVWVTDNINTVQSASGQDGKVFIDILSTGDFENEDFTDSNVVDITGFTLNYYRVDVENVGNEIVYGDMLSRREYTAKNGNMSRADWNNDVIYASGKIDSDFGFGLVFKTDNRPMSTASYASGDQEPEQHQANRVANYWASTRRMIRANLRSNEVPLISPGMFLTIDGTRCYPLSISHEWRDDVINVSLIEIHT
jgi:hypothetical protein